MKKIILLSLFAVFTIFNLSAQSDNYSFKDVLAWAGGNVTTEDPTVKAVLPSEWEGKGYTLSIKEDESFVLTFKGTTKVTGVVDVVNKPLKLIFTTPTDAVGNCPHYINMKVNETTFVLKDCHEKRKIFTRK